MPREKSENSNRSFGGLDLTKEQEKYLRKYLERKGVSLACFTRSLYRGWLKTREIGVSDLTDNL